MSKRILVIEDQQDNRQILRDLLTSADFEVISIRRVRRAAMPSSASLSARVSSLRRSASTCPRLRRRGDRMKRKVAATLFETGSEKIGKRNACEQCRKVGVVSLSIRCQTDRCILPKRLNTVPKELSGNFQ